MKRSYDFKPAAFLAASVLPTLLLFSTLLLPAAAVAQTAPPGKPKRELSAVAELGRKMFFDPSLSGSGKLACASCHSPSHNYGPPNDRAVQLGGREGTKPGLRAVPSLKYVLRTLSFTVGPNPEVPDADDLVLPITPAAGVKVAAAAKANAAARAAADATVPRGGLDWDGRAPTIQSQALGPLLDPNEMNNTSEEEVLDHIKHAPYAEDMIDLFGPTLFKQPKLALDEALFALVRYQIEEPGFHPYSSKYDAWLAGNAKLSEAEERGLKLFDDPDKGNCFSCHIDRPSRDGRFPPAFTDYEFEALGAPRNMAIPANSNPDYYDLGLCGPLRKDYANTPEYCGLFKTPSLRNVATRKVFFHNGVFHSLEEVLRFYVERETKPEKWYPRLPNGEIDRYNDLPAKYKQNIDVVDAPFDRKHGDEPALNEAEIADVVAFLKTLTDGWTPGQDQAVSGAAQAAK